MTSLFFLSISFEELPNYKFLGGKIRELLEMLLVLRYNNKLTRKRT